MKHRSLWALVVVAITQSLASTAHASDIQGTCFFNTRTMPCTVSKDPYTLNLLWLDGRTTQYRLDNETGLFLDQENGVWDVSHDQSRGLFLQHSDGNAVGFRKRRMDGTNTTAGVRKID